MDLLHIIMAKKSLMHMNHHLLLLMMNMQKIDLTIFIETLKLFDTFIFFKNC